MPRRPQLPPLTTPDPSELAEQLQGFPLRERLAEGVVRRMRVPQPVLGPSLRGALRELISTLPPTIPAELWSGQVSAPLAYRLVPPPWALQVEEPVALEGGPAPCWSAWRKVDERERDRRIAAGNAVLDEIAQAGFSLRWPEEPAQRTAFVARMRRAWQCVLEAAEVAAFVEIAPRVRPLPLVPGELPAPLAGALHAFLFHAGLASVHAPLPLAEANEAEVSAREDGDVDDETEAEAERTVKRPIVREPEPTMAAEARASRRRPAEATAPSRLQALRPALRDAARRLARGDGPCGWWIEQRHLAEGAVAITDHLLATGERDGTTIVFPWGWDPAQHSTGGVRPGPPERAPFAWPIAFSIADLQLRPAPSGGPESGTAASTALIDAWATEVVEHRDRHGRQPAVLVLDGDIVDLRGGSSAKAARDRLVRILRDHAGFFDAITRWADANPLNFVVYVGGDHDAPLRRRGLGAALAAHLHPTRAAFAAEALLLPELVAVFEHRHRGYAERLEPWLGAAASWGELLVSMVLDPIASAPDAAKATTDDMVDQRIHVVGRADVYEPTAPRLDGRITAAQHVACGVEPMWLGGGDPSASMTRASIHGAFLDTQGCLLRPHAQPGGSRYVLVEGIHHRAWSVASPGAWAAAPAASPSTAPAFSQRAFNLVPAAW